MLNLRELSASDEVRYAELLKLHEASCRATKRTLGLYPGTLFVKYTTVSQKTEGGAHTLLRRRREGGDARARCNPSREHPYSHCVGASILYLNDGDSGIFVEGEYYFGTPDGEVGRKVPVERGAMVCFTGGLKGLHSVLLVKRRSAGGADSDKKPCRLALAPNEVDPDSLLDSVHTEVTEIVCVDMQSAPALPHRHTAVVQRAWQVYLCQYRLRGV
ncbi:hypothetical protein ACHAWF_006875 [Thalassiosira exigua]